MNIPDSIGAPLAYTEGEICAHVTVSDENKEDVKKLFEQEYLKAVKKEMIDATDGSRPICLYSSEEKYVSPESESEQNEMEIDGYYWSFDPTVIDNFGTRVYDTEEGFNVSYDTPMYAIPFGEFSVCDSSNAVIAALSKVEKAFSEISYYGIETFDWTDEHGGEFECHFYSNADGEKDLKKAIEEMFQNAWSSDYFWDCFNEMYSEFAWGGNLDKIVSFLKENASILGENAVDILCEHIEDEDDAEYIRKKMAQDE